MHIVALAVPVAVTLKLKQYCCHRDKITVFVSFYFIVFFSSKCRRRRWRDDVDNVDNAGIEDF